MCSAPFRESFERGFVLWDPGQGRIQRANYFIHMFLLNDVRGQEAQHGLVGAIDEDSLLQQSRDDGFRGFDRIEIHLEHQPHAAYFMGCYVLLFWLVSRRGVVMASVARVDKPW